MSDVVDAAASIGTFEQFVAAINAHDTEALTSLMTEDHLFVDAMGNRVQGAQSMRAGWRGYFAMCPDYWIKIRNSMAERGTVLATARLAAPSMTLPGERPQPGRR
jgi:ketosteroid isomerase-like protein